MWKGFGKIGAPVFVSVVLLATACLFSPENTGEGETPGYYSPVDSTYKLVENFKLAYTTKNLDAYMDCLHDEFEFYLLETDWDDYNGDGLTDSSWARDIEEQMTANMFSSTHAEVIELTLDGYGESTWYGDSTGATLQLIRQFQLKVYYTDPEGVQQGYRAVGQVLFLVKRNEDGDYQIWRWYDQSEV